MRDLLTLTIPVLALSALITLALFTNTWTSLTALALLTIIIITAVIRKDQE